MAEFYRVRFQRGPDEEGRISARGAWEKVEGDKVVGYFDDTGAEIDRADLDGSTMGYLSRAPMKPPFDGGAA